MPHPAAGATPQPWHRFEVVDGRPVLDEFGNVVGGLRSPYVSRVIKSVARRVAQRVITVPDGRDLIGEASRADVP